MIVVIKLRARDIVRRTITSGVSMFVQLARRTQPALLAMIAGWPTARHSARVQAEAFGQTARARRLLLLTRPLARLLARAARTSA